MAGEGKFGLNIEAVYVHTDDGPVPLLDYLEQSGGDVTIAWGDVTGKPARFAPDEHTHAVGDVDGLTDELAGKASSSDLADALAGKADASTVSALEADLATLTGRVDLLEEPPEG